MKGKHIREDRTAAPRVRALVIAGVAALAVLALACALLLAGGAAGGAAGQDDAVPETQAADVQEVPSPEMDDGEGVLAASEDLAAEPADEGAQAVQSQQMASAEAAVRSLVQGYGEKVAVAVVPLDGSAGFSVNGDEKFVSASMIKLLVLAEFIDEVDAGTLSLSGAYVKSSADVVGGTGQMQNEASGTTYTLDTLAKYMIKYSDNTATNVLIDKMGMSAINAKAAALGLLQTDLQRKMMRLGAGVENHISANDAAAILSGIANGLLGSQEMCQKAQDYLLEQTDAEGLTAGLPSGVKFGHKTGSLDAVRHDGGIVYADNPYVIVVLTDIGAAQANSLMSQVSAAVYNQLG